MDMKCDDCAPGVLPDEQSLKMVYFWMPLSYRKWRWLSIRKRVPRAKFRATIARFEIIAVTRSCGSRGCLQSVLSGSVDGAGM
jgi:hypothetical protein